MLNEAQLAIYFKMKHLPIKDDEWWDGKPRYYSNLKKWSLQFTQKFGQNLLDYSQFGLKGHNGIDIGFAEGCPIAAPCKLWITFLQDSDGYGRNVWAETESKQINGDYYKLELCFGHNKEFACEVYKWSDEGKILAYGDSTGFSTGHHSHIGIRPYIKKNGSWVMMFPDNGFKGWIDPEPFFPHIVWDVDELTNKKDFMTEFKEKHDGQLIFNNKTGEIGWFYDGKLRIPKDNERFVTMLASYLVRSGGANISSDDWDKLTKEDF